MSVLAVSKKIDEMKLMKLTAITQTGMPGYTVWVNPMKVQTMAELRKAAPSIANVPRTEVWVECPNGEGGCYHVEESPDEVARLFEEATR